MLACRHFHQQSPFLQNNRSTGSLEFVSCYTNLQHRQTSFVDKEARVNFTVEEVAVIFFLWQCKTKRSQRQEGCSAGVFVKHVLELQGAVYWENGALQKMGGREVAERGERRRENFDEAPGVSLMRDDVRELLRSSIAHGATPHCYNQPKDITNGLN